MTLRDLEVFKIVSMYLSFNQKQHTTIFISTNFPLYWKESESSFYYALFFSSK